MRHASAGLAAAIGVFGLGGAALGAAEDAARYTMSPTEGGFVRLDRESGAMAFCTGKEGDWSCKPMAEAEVELKSRIEELEAENKALRDQQHADVTPPPAGVLPDGALPDSVPPTPPGNLPIPDEKDVDKLFDYVEGMMKKFKERIKRLEKEAQKEETPL